MSGLWLSLGSRVRVRLKG